MNDPVNIDEFANRIDKTFGEILERVPGPLKFAYIDAIDIIYGHISDAMDAPYVKEYPERLQEYRSALTSGNFERFLGNIDVEEISERFMDAITERVELCFSKGRPELASIYVRAAEKFFKILGNKREEVRARAN